MLRIEQLQVHGLPPLTFEVASGECLAIEGPSGSGKTLLLRAIADLDEAAGYVTLDGQERREMPATAWRRLVRFVAAEAAWWGDTPRESIADAARAERGLRALGLTPEHLDRPLARLSTGERQRLALVRALADEPKVLLLDEPTAALDATNAALAEEMIRFQILAGRCVVLVSHDPSQIGRLADASLQLAEGRAMRPAPEAVRAAGTAS